MHGTNVWYGTTKYGMNTFPSTYLGGTYVQLWCCLIHMDFFCYSSSRICTIHISSYRKHTVWTLDLWYLLWEWRSPKLQSLPIKRGTEMNVQIPSISHLHYHQLPDKRCLWVECCILVLLFLRSGQEVCEDVFQPFPKRYVASLNFVVQRQLS